MKKKITSLSQSSVAKKKNKQTNKQKQANKRIRRGTQTLEFSAMRML